MLTVVGTTVARGYDELAQWRVNVTVDGQSESITIAQMCDYTLDPPFYVGMFVSEPERTALAKVSISSLAMQLSSPSSRRHHS